MVDFRGIGQKQMIYSILKLLRAQLTTGFLLVLGLIFLTHCTSKEAAKDDPDAQFQQAEESFQDEHYLLALDKYREVKNRFPYSSRATDSELRIADTYFAQESYIESESAYEIFKELHPTHPKIDYVQFQIGMSFYNQIPSSSARDLSAAYRAIDAFQVVKAKFPSSEFATKAEELIAESRRKLAEHEEYVADFYFQRKHYLSASYRYNSLLAEFGKLGYDEEALYRLGVCYMNIRMFGNARDAFNRLLTEHPQSSMKSDTLSLLKEIEKKTQ
jgi:outer membrane protein assembly factor BamD